MLDRLRAAIPRASSCRAADDPALAVREPRDHLIGRAICDVDLTYWGQRAQSLRSIAGFSPRGPGSRAATNRHTSAADRSPAVLRPGLLDRRRDHRAPAARPHVDGAARELGATRRAPTSSSTGAHRPTAPTASAPRSTAPGTRSAPTRSRRRPALIVLIAPPPGDPHHAAARAGLENLARTLSIEWARHRIRPVAILPGARTTRRRGRRARRLPRLARRRLLRRLRVHPSLAQGTSTESSVGESRATTYSAGSVSDRLRRRASGAAARRACRRARRSRAPRGGRPTGSRCCRRACRARSRSSRGSAAATARPPARGSGP